MNISLSSSTYFQKLTPTRTVVTSFTPRRCITTLSSSSSSSFILGEGLAGGDDNNNNSSYYEDGDWILCLATSGWNQIIACAISNGALQVYDQIKLLPLFSNYFPHHTAPTTTTSSSSNAINNNPVMITDLVYGPENNNTIVTTANNGSVIVTDLRQVQQQNQHAALQTGIISEQAYSVAVGYDGYVAAVGTGKGRIHFFDLRNAGKVVGSYVEAHTDCITQLKFRGSHLISGSEDGLICSFDTTQSSEQMAIQCVMNVGIPVRKIGFCSNESIYCLTGSETASIWDISSATCINDFYRWNLRQSLTNEIVSSSRSYQRQQQQQHQPISIDYLIDAYWDESIQQLQLAAGTNYGDAVLFVLSNSTENNNNNNGTGSSYENHSSSSSSSNTYYTWKASHALTGGHKGIVRACCPLATSSVIITAGEDARLCEWNKLGKQLHGLTSTISKPTTSTFTTTDNTIWQDSSSQTTQQRRPSLNDPSLNNTGHGTRLGGGGGPLRRQHRHKQTSTPY